MRRSVTTPEFLSHPSRRRRNSVGDILDEFGPAPVPLTLIPPPAPPEPLTRSTAKPLRPLSGKENITKLDGDNVRTTSSDNARTMNSDKGRSSSSDNLRPVPPVLPPSALPPTHLSLPSAATAEEQRKSREFPSPPEAFANPALGSPAAAGDGESRF